MEQLSLSDSFPHRGRVSWHLGRRRRPVVRKRRARHWG